MSSDQLACCLCDALQKKSTFVTRSFVMNRSVGSDIPYHPLACKLKDKADDDQNSKRLVRPRCDSNAQSLVPKTNALTIRPRGRFLKLLIL